MTAQGTTVAHRPMRWWDLEEVLALEEALFADDPWTAGMFWSELAQPDTRHYVVAVPPAGEDDIVGYAGLAVLGDESYVQTVAVMRDRWGAGLGGVLVTHLLDAARQRGVRTVLLEVRADNDAARRLYDRAGFEVISVRRRYYQPGDVDALVMRLLVPMGDA